MSGELSKTRMVLVLDADEVQAEDPGQVGQVWDSCRGKRRFRG